MSKAERRRKARARAREREEAAVPADALEQAVAAVAAEPEPAVLEGESEFITGPVVARREVPIDRRTVRGTTLGGQPVADRRRAPAAQVEEDVEESSDEDDEDEDLIDGEGEGDEDEDDGDEDDEEELDAQEDALFEVACAAVEQGDALTWQETVALLVTAEVTDPRLALLVGLLMEGAPEEETADKHVPLQVTGARVLRILTELSLGELVEEAREVASLAPGEDQDSPDERAMVRTSARALNELSKKELADGKNGERGRKDSSRPVHASELKARRAATAKGQVRQ